MPRIRPENPESLAQALQVNPPDIYGSFVQGQELARGHRMQDFQKKLQEAGLLAVTPSLQETGQKVGIDLSQQENVPLKDAILLANQARLLSKPAALPKAATELTPYQKASLALREKGQGIQGAQLELGKKRLEGQPERQAQGSALKAFNEQNTAISSLDKSLGLLTNAANAIGGYSPDIVSQMVGKGATRFNEASAEPKTKNYLQSVKTVLAEIARGPLKQKGVLTDKDIELANDVISKPENPLNQKLASIERLRYQSFSNLAASAQTAGKTDVASQYNQKANDSLAKMNKLLDITQGAASPTNNVSQDGQDFVKQMEAKGFKFKGVRP